MEKDGEEVEVNQSYQEADHEEHLLEPVDIEEKLGIDVAVEADNDDNLSNGSEIDVEVEEKPYSRPKRNTRKPLMFTYEKVGIPSWKDQE